MSKSAKYHTDGPHMKLLKKKQIDLVEISVESQFKIWIGYTQMGIVGQHHQQ